MIGLLRLLRDVFVGPPPPPCPTTCDHYWQGLAAGMAMRMEHGKEAARQVWRA